MADLISRAAAIEEMRRFREIMYDNRCKPSWYDAVGIVKDMPAVDAVPVVHAWPVWINPLNSDAKICTWKCSSLCSACGDYVAVSWKYCPNCGAKMDGEQRLAFADQSGAEYADNPTV